MANILIIDDEPELRDMMGRFISSLGHNVVEASGGDEGGRILSSEGEFDLVITDIVMAEGDGLEVISTIRKSGYHLPVIAVSGGGRVPGDVYLKLAEHLGADRALDKPFSLTRLQTMIDELVVTG
jgi:CheY-like chemotaxis protein